MPPTETVEPEIILESTTESQAELDHATGPNRREHFDPTKAQTEATEESKETKTEPASEPGKTGSRKQGESEADKDDDLPKGAKKRIDTLTARLKAAEERAKAAEEKATKAQPVKAATSDDPEPSLEAFRKAGKSWEEWNSAHARWDVREELRATEAKKAEAAQKESLKATYDAHLERVNAAREEHADFDEKVNSRTVTFSSPQANQAFQMAIVEADNGAAILYHLAEHPDEMETIASLSPVKVQLALGRLSAALSPSTSKPAPKKPVSQTPAPTTPVRGSTTVASNNLYDEKLDTDEYIRRRSAQKSNRRN